MIARLAAAVLALAAATPALGQEGSEGAEAFVREIFAGYANEDPDNLWPMEDANLDRVWSPRMADLIRRDRALAPDGDLPYLDADPLCDCQDWRDLAVRSVTVARTDQASGRVVTVRFVNMGQPETTVVRLSGHPGSWRIDDVLTPGGPGLARALEASNERVARGRPALGRD